MKNRALITALGFSGTLHLGLILGVWINGGFTRPAAPDAPPTLKVSLVLHMAEPETVDQPQPQPEPEPEPQPQPEPTPVQVAEPAPVAPPKPEPEQPREPEPETPASVPQDEPPIESETAPLQAEAAPPALDTGYLQDLEQRYMAALRQAIEAQKYYPRRARRLGHQGSVRIEFILERDGRLRDIRIAESSGSRALDKAALKAVKTVGRFEPIPQELAQRRWPLDVALNYELE